VHESQLLYRFCLFAGKKTDMCCNVSRPEKSPPSEFVAKRNAHTDPITKYHIAVPSTPEVGNWSHAGILLVPRICISSFPVCSKAV
jgi:hypothetical protein